MRFLGFIAFSCVAVWVVLGGPSKDAYAQTDAPSADESAAILDADPTDRSVLDQLFADLRKAENERAAGRILEQIDHNWRTSNGETAALLLGRADEAIAEEEMALALDILDQLIALEPTFSEAWNRRATLHYMRNEYGPALSDIAVVLELEPRHFGAMTGLGLILEDLGENERAYEVLSRALFLNPFQENVRKEMQSLESAVVGQET